MSEQPDAATLFEQVGADPSLDLLMQKDPRDVTLDDLEAAIRVRRQERAFNVKAQREAPAEPE